MPDGDRPGHSVHLHAWTLKSCRGRLRARTTPDFVVFIVGERQLTFCCRSKATEGTIVLLRCGTARAAAGPVSARDGTRGGQWV